jgi:hypothetical protein
MFTWYVCLLCGMQAQRAHGQWVPYIDKGGKGIFYYNKVCTNYNDTANMFISKAAYYTAVVCA